MSCEVSLVPTKIAKYTKLMIELVWPCKYGVSFCIRTYVLLVWRASLTMAHMPLVVCGNAP